MKVNFRLGCTGKKFKRQRERERKGKFDIQLQIIENSIRSIYLGLELESCHSNYL